jgi:hypothetical protein
MRSRLFALSDKARLFELVLTTRVTKPSFSEKLCRELNKYFATENQNLAGTPFFTEISYQLGE